MQLAVRVTVLPTSGEAGLAEIVQFGTTACQLTPVETAVPVPAPLLATTEYVCTPALVDDAEHVLAVLEQLVHAKLVGLLVQFALRSTDVPTDGVALLVESTHTGTGGPGCQPTVTDTGAPGPAPFVALTQ